MDIEAMIVQLGEYERARKLLTVAVLAKLFGVSVQTLGLWIRKRKLVVEGFPAPVRWGESQYSGRYWRPDELIAWLQRYLEGTSNLLTLQQIANRVGLRGPDSLQKMWKKGKFPVPKTRQLLTGAWLWDRDEVEAWLEQRTGGYAFPVSGEPPLLSDPPADEPQADDKRRGPKRREGMSAAAEAA